MAEVVATLVLAVARRLTRLTIGLHCRIFYREYSVYLRIDTLGNVEVPTISRASEILICIEFAAHPARFLNSRQAQYSLGDTKRGAQACQSPNRIHPERTV